MKKLIKFFPLPEFFSTIRAKLTIAYSLNILLPLLIFGALFITGSGKIVETQLIKLADASNVQTVQRLNNMIQSYSSLTDQYVFDVLFIRSLRQKYTSAMYAYNLYVDIWSRQRKNLSILKNIRNITIYTENPTLVSSTPYLIRTDDYIDSSLIYSKVQQSGYKGVWSGMRKMLKKYEYWNPQNNVVKGLAPVAFTFNRSLGAGASVSALIGMITVEIDGSVLDDIMLPSMKGMEYYVVDELGNTISAKEIPTFLENMDITVDGNKGEPRNIDGKKYLIWNTALDNGWSLISTVSLDIVTKQAHSMRFKALIILSIITIAAMGAISFISNALTKRVRLLMEKMNGIDINMARMENTIRGNDEITALDRTFVLMTKRLQDSAERQYGAEVKRKAAELELLHTQINPHFLYNMLSSIAWLTESHQPLEVRSAIESLAVYYRLTLAKGREIITLREELTGLSAYIELQRLRFGGRIRCLTDIDEVFLNIPIPRLTLQPLVENSITHGMGTEKRLISVAITAEIQGEALRLLVKDDGVGMDTERLKQIEYGEIRSGVGSGLGYHNVAERIHLHFGDPYGLNVYSQVGRGTTVEIILPLSDMDSYL